MSLIGYMFNRVLLAALPLLMVLESSGYAASGETLAQAR